VVHWNWKWKLGQNKGSQALASDDDSCRPPCFASEIKRWSSLVAFRYIVGTRYHTSIWESGMNCTDLPCMHFLTFKNILNLVLWCIFLFTLERSDRVVCSFSLLISRISWYLTFLSSAYIYNYIFCTPTTKTHCLSSFGEVRPYRLHAEASGSQGFHTSSVSSCMNP
jgi:hypothetical protein